MVRFSVAMISVDLFGRRACSQFGLQLALVQRTFPLRDDQGCNTVADHVDKCAAFRNESVDTKDEDQTRDREARHRTQRRCQDDEGTAADTRGALGRQ